MRLSEAILLGSALIRPRRGDVGSEPNGPGCAWGMALEAAGVARTRALHSEEWRQELRTLANRLWPWAHLPVQMNLPCDCQAHATNLANAIIHLFDHHVERVTCRREPWTIEQLAAYVARVEPMLVKIHRTGLELVEADEPKVHHQET